MLSVQRQKGCTFEHIIINDASDDNTSNIVSKFKCSKTTLINKSLNSGQAICRNEGLDLAKGEYIVFLDADDEFADQTALRRWVSNFDSSFDLIKARNHIYKEKSSWKSESHTFPNNVLYKPTRLDCYPELLNSTSCWQFLYKRDFLLKQGLKFSTDLKQREDRVFFFEVLHKAKKIGITNEIVIKYYIRDGSTMRTLNLQQLKMFTIHLDLVRQIVVKENSTDDVRAYTLSYYYSTLKNYWAKLVVENIGSKEVKEFLSALANLSNAASCNNIKILEITQDNITPFDVQVIDFLIISRDLDSLKSYLQNKSIAFDSIYKFFKFSKKYNSWLNCRNFFQSKFKNSKRFQAEDFSFSDYEFIVHIGLPKTGSSSIQNSFDLDRDYFYEEHGLYFPISGMEYGQGKRSHRISGHARLVSEISNNENNSLSELLNELNSLPKKPSKVFLSCENIASHRFWNRGEILVKLAKVFGKKVQILMSVRNQVDWVNSMYAEMVISPGERLAKSTTEFLKDWDFSYLDFSEVNRIVEECFSKQPIYIDYDDKKCSLLDNYLSVLSIDVGEHKSFELPKELQNISVSSIHVDIIRTLNRVPMSREKHNELCSLIFSNPASGKNFLTELDVNFLHSKYYSSNEIFEKYTGVRIKFPLLENSVKRRSSTFVTDTESFFRFFESININSANTTQFDKDFIKHLIIFYKHLLGRNLLTLLVKYKYQNLSLKKLLKFPFYIKVDFYHYINRYGDEFYSQKSIFIDLLKNQNRLPNAEFDPNRYLRLNSDLADKNIHLALHFYEHGVKEGRPW
jgi:capsular polysaccharide export protein